MYAQNSNKVIEGLIFEDIQKDLIAQNKYVTDLFEDSNGFIWMGSFYGVNVYDGTNFSFYKDHLDNNDGFKGYRVRNIIESSSGDILVAMRNSGVNVFDASTGKFKNYYNSIFKGAKSDIIQYISENKNGKLYITTNKDIIIAKFDENKNLVQQQVLKVEFNKKEYIRSGLFFKGNFLVETNQRILKLEEIGTSTLYEGFNIRKCRVKQNELWIRADQKIGRLNIKDKTVNWLNYDLPKEEVFITDFEFASKNLLFIGTRKGCIQIKLGTDYEVLESKKLKINGTYSVVRIFSDKSNNLYFSVSGVGGGIKKLNINQLDNKYISLPPLDDKYLLDIFLNDSNKTFWAGSSNGVFAYSTKTKAFLKFSNSSIIGLKGFKILDIVEINGAVFLNTNKGLAKYNKQKNNFEIFENLKGIKVNLTNKLCVYNNNLWFMTAKGIARFNTQTFKTKYFDVAELTKFDTTAVPKNYTSVFNVQEPSAINIKNNMLWLNIQTKGLFSFDISSGTPKFINSYKEDFSMLFLLSIYSPVRAINFDNLDRLWLSGVNGIYVYDYKKREIVTHLNKSNVLNLDVLYDLLKDEKGNFWVKQFKAPAINIDANTFEVIEKTPSWMHLPTKIGETDFNSGPTYQDYSKQIFINGVNGYLVYQPNKLVTEKEPPRVVLTNININDEPKYSNFIGTQKLTVDELNYDENSILLNLKSISHNNSPLQQFAYRLKGVSDEWTYTKTLEPLNYIGLNPDSYTLEVKSTNDGKNWSSVITLATFDILSPWWKTTTAYIIYLLLFIAIIYAFYEIQLTRKLAVSEANQLKQLDDFKNKFYQNITHEFRTPLTVIIGMAESLESKASKMIKRNASQLLSLVNELLQIGKIESNSANLKLSSVDIVEFSKYCMESLESLAMNKNIALNFKSNSDTILMEFDVDKMQLVLNNLIANAIKFTPENGTVEVSVMALNQIVEIKVIDSGIGISKENLEKVFERYFQEKNHKTQYGTGIGLALSRELIQLMNGTLKANNNKDNGANFVVTLPLEKETYINNQKKQLSSNLYKDDDSIEKDENIVLVIEDNKDVLTYITSILDKSYTVYAASNGKLGYEKAIELIPDLIISDVMMPIMDGYETCEKIKSDFRTNHIPVIMLTAKVDLNSKISGLKLGADVYLGKPFNSEELLTHISNLISIRETLKTKYSKNFLENKSDEIKTQNPFITKITEVLLNNISDDTFGINEICKEIGISRTQLHRKLKALTGLSTSKFIREIRLKKAYELIKNSELFVSEVAYSVGFSDPNYFTKLFTERFNTPPSKVDK